MKNKKDLQSFMREKLSKTKISSEATTQVSSTGPSVKNFVKKPQSQSVTDKDSEKGKVLSV